MPNLPVDVNSWGRSACYPRRTFYPLSDGPSTQNHRITKPDFRLCSNCRSRSQAPFCLYTRRLITDQPEGTFGRLRYLLGGPPQSNYPPDTVSALDYRARLEYQNNQGGISTSAPPDLAAKSHSLPPILHRSFQHPISRCSKGAQGLSV